jgi:agmatinase
MHEGFLGLATSAWPTADEKAATPFAIAGIPYDGAVSNRPGAREGPQAIRKASRMLCDALHPYFACTPLGLMSDYGNLQFPLADILNVRAALEPQITYLLARHHMVWLGGDHSISLPILRQLYKQYHGPIALLHLDAHCDTWTDHFGEPSGHGTWVHEALTEGLLLPACSMQVGLRSPASEAVWRRLEAEGGLILQARDLRNCFSGLDWSKKLEPFRQRLAQAGNPPVYLTIDIDCLDPGFAPGTGTPEPAGLTPNQVMSLLEESHDLNFVGIDLCEVAPAYDHAEITSLNAAYFLWTYLCGQIKKLNH